MHAEDVVCYAKDGSPITRESQTLFASAAKMTHDIGLADYHAALVQDADSPLRPGHPQHLVDAVQRSRELLIERFPRSEHLIVTALDGYFEVGAQHSEPELCHYCRSHPLAAATAVYPQSGIAADLCAVI